MKGGGFMVGWFPLEECLDVGTFWAMMMLTTTLVSSSRLCSLASP